MLDKSSSRYNLAGKVKNMDVAIVYDNDAVGEFISGWGFSCYLKNKMKVLFDTGWDGEILLHNLELFGIDDLDLIVLSHQHWDHIGGLNHVISMTSQVCVPETFSPNLKREIARKADLIVVRKQTHLGDCFYSTGVLGSRIPEQALVAKTLVVTGCSHPGLDKILSSAEKLGEINIVLGGFHDFDKIEILKKYKTVIPCHCTVLKEEMLKMPNTRRCYAGCFFEV